MSNPKSEATVKVVTTRSMRIQKNGPTLPPGTVREVSPKKAENMIARGVATLAQVEMEAAKPVKPIGADLTAAIVDAIGKLDRDNDEHFTAKGVPVTSALEKVLGYDITTKERGLALEAIKKAEKK